MARPRGTKTGIFRSKFEARFSEEFGLAYEQDSFKYLIPATTHQYTPDWRVSDSVYIETKGVFTAADRQKLLYIKEQHPEIIVAIVFQKDLFLGKRLGTCLSWCVKFGFIAFLEVDQDGIRKFIASANAKPIVV